MARKIFIAATGQNSGKTTTSLSLMHLARKKYGRVGFIKPLGPKPTPFRGGFYDKDAVLMAEVFGLEEQIALMSPVVLHPGSTKDILDGRIAAESLRQRMAEAIAELDTRNDFLIIEGSGHGGVGSVIGLSNAAVARLAGAPVMIVSGGGIGNATDAVVLNLSLFRQEGVPVKLVLVNKLQADKRESTLHYLQLAFRDLGVALKGGFNYSPILANPTLSRIAKILDRPLRATPEEARRIIHHIQLGAASSQRVIDLLEEATLMVINSTRDELIVTASSLYHLPDYRGKIAGLVIAGLNPISGITQTILDDSQVPYLRTEITNSEAFSIVTSDVSKITAEDAEKLALVRNMAERDLDFDAIDALL
jgi:BioD-like phosphotransacetylase family protein